MNLFYIIATLMMRAAMHLLTRWQVRALAPLPDGPFILASNHLSHIDPPLLSASVPLARRIVFMAKEEIFHSPFSGFLARGVNAISVRRGEADRAAFRQAIQVLEQDHVLGMFPEGTRSRNRHLQSGHPGTAIIAFRSGLPVVPAAITGSEQVRGLGLLWQRPRITVTLGPAFTLPPPAERANSAYVNEVTQLIMGRIAAMLPPEYQPTAAPSEAASVLPSKKAT